MKIITDRNLYREHIPPEASLYLQPAWMDLFSENWNAKIGVNAKNEVLWLWPFLEKTRYGIRKYGRIPYCPDNGPVFLDKKVEDSFTSVVNRLFSMTVVDDRRNLLNTEKMVQDSWKYETRYYQYFDLRQYPREFQAISRTKRKTMRRNSYLDFSRLDTLAEVSSLFLTSFYAVGQTDVTMEDLEKWNRALDGSFDHYLFGIRNSEGDILSAQWLVGYRDTLYGWLGARHPEYKEAGMELLLWHILQWARDHYQIYDLGGSSIPGVRQFNLSMGAEEGKYQRYTRFHPRWAGKVHGWIGR